MMQEHEMMNKQRAERREERDIEDDMDTAEKTGSVLQSESDGRLMLMFLFICEHS